jgi:hypothetical protein
LCSVSSREFQYTCRWAMTQPVNGMCQVPLCGHPALNAMVCEKA